MHIKILGTRGEIEETAPYHSKKSGVLLDDKILLDCGDESFLSYNPDCILITHLHPDHAYFVRHKQRPLTTAQIYAPEAYDAVNIHITNDTFSLNGYKITPIPTIHSIKVLSNAYLIEHAGKKILYTGDMLWIDAKYRKLIKNLDLVITEASSMRKGGLIRRDKKTGHAYGHTGVPDLVALFKHYTHTMLFVHFGAWFHKDISEARKKFTMLAKENGIEIIVGYDGLELKV
jgi:ribonuclease BN (tRNA processing enzyme)